MKLLNLYLINQKQITCTCFLCMQACNRSEWNLNRNCSEKWALPVQTPKSLAVRRFRRATGWQRPAQNRSCVFWAISRCTSTRPANFRLRSRDWLGEGFDHPIWIQRHCKTAKLFHFLYKSVCLSFSAF